MSALLQKQQPASPGANLLAVFPRRAIVVNYAGVLGNFLIMTTCTLLFGGLTVMLMYFWVPDIVQDWKMKGSRTTELDQTATVQGACKRMKFVFIDCSAKITYQPDLASPATATVEQDFIFLGTSHATTVDVLRNGRTPARVTTSLATEHLGNRIFTLIALGAILASLALGSLWQGWLGLQRRALQGKAVLLRPVLVTLLEVDEHSNIKFEGRVDGKVVKGANRLRDGDAPLQLLSQPDRGLAAMVPATGHLILIDDDLTVLDFTDAERAQIRAAR